MADLDYFTYDTAENPDILFCMLHGLGASGHDFETLPDYLRFPGYKVRFLFPHAPSRPVTINQGFVMPAWYDILSLAIDQKKDLVGMQASIDALQKLLDQHYTAHFRPERTILAGFSQGGAVALWKALQDQKNYLGVLCLSGYLFDTTRPLAVGSSANLAEKATGQAHPQQHPLEQPKEQTQQQPQAQPEETKTSPALSSMIQKTLAQDPPPPHPKARPPIFFGHGLQDSVVPYALAKFSYQSVVEWGYRATLKSYPIEHGVSLAEYRDLETWCLESFKARL